MSAYTGTSARNPQLKVTTGSRPNKSTVAFRLYRAVLYACIAPCRMSHCGTPRPDASLRNRSIVSVRTRTVSRGYFAHLLAWLEAGCLTRLPVGVSGIATIRLGPSRRMAG